MNKEDLKTEGESCDSGAPRNYQDPDAVCYLPIDNLKDLLDYGVTREIVNGVEVEVETIPACILVEKTLPISTAFSDIKIQVNGRRFRSSGCPKTLVCHDMKGGYLDDRYVKGTDNPKQYVFRHWLQTDIFCYFSHYFVTIPPLGWINAAHKHGVQCIGTIITEDERGQSLCKELLRDRDTMEKAVKKLCMVAEHYGFDGYLVNIENNIEKPKELIEFVRMLHKSMKSVDPNAVVVWYDAVGVNGKLDHQNELNKHNMAFFDACDGIFLNYEWSESNLLRSVENADDRELDVFVGVDVFGRTRSGIRGVDTHLNVKKVADCGLSVAIFAPGWAFENSSFEEFPHIDNILWMNCAKYFYFRTLNVADANETEIDGGVVSVPATGKYQVLISTDFCLGLGLTKFQFGKKPPVCEEAKACPWFNLNKQSYQPALNCFRSSGVLPCAYAQFESSRGFLGGVSLNIPAIAQDEIEHSSPLWIPLHVSLGQNVRNDAGTKYAAVVMVAWQSDNLREMKIDATGSNHPIKIFLEFMQPSVSTRKVIRLSNISEQIAFELPKDPVTIHLKDFITESQLNSQDDSIPNVNIVFNNVPYAEADVNDWKISCFMMDMNHCIDWNITAFRLGAITPVTVGLLSLALLSYS